MTLWAALVAVACSGSVRDIQEPGEGVQFELVLNVAGERYLVDQPVKVYVGVKNVGKAGSTEDIELYPNMTLALELSGPDSAWIPYKFGRMITSGYGPGATFRGVGAGQTALLEYDLRGADAEKKLLDKPGKWKLRAHYGGLKAGPVEFSVEEPGGRDVAAHVALGKMGFMLGKYGAGGWGQEITGPLPRFLADHAGSGYAPDAAMSLGSALAESGMAGREAEVDEGAKLLARFDTEWATHQQAPRAMLVQAKIARHRGKDNDDREAACAILKRLEEKHPLFACTQDFIKLRKELEKK